MATAPSRWRRAFPAAAAVPARAARRGEKLEILAHTHPAGSIDRFGAELADSAVRTLTYVDGDQTKAIALSLPEISRG